MRLGESLEWQKIEVADIFVSKKIRQKIVAFVIPGAGGRLRSAACYHLEIRIRRIAGEILIRVHLFVPGMIHRQEFHSIEVDNFLHGLHETETEYSPTLPQRTREGWGTGHIFCPIHWVPHPCLAVFWRDRVGTLTF